MDEENESLMFQVHPEVVIRRSELKKSKRDLFKNTNPTDGWAPSFD